MVWDASLGMSLYTYRLFNGSIRDNTAAIERNGNLYAQYSMPENVSWSANTTYTPDPISYEWYTETMVQDVEPPKEEEQPVVEQPAVEETPVVEDPIVEVEPDPIPSEPEPVDPGVETPVDDAEQQTVE